MKRIIVALWRGIFVVGVGFVIAPLFWREAPSQWSLLGTALLVLSTVALLAVWISSTGYASQSIPVLSHTAGESLTDFELTFMARPLPDGTHPCVDCCTGRLLAGPRGGESRNVVCNKCQSEFNLCWLTPAKLDGERISDRGPRDAGDRGHLYEGYFQ